jgi:hypothetical protein
MENKNLFWFRQELYLWGKHWLPLFKEAFVSAFLSWFNWFVIGLLATIYSLVIATLCVYNSKTTPPNNLECRAEEKMRCPRIQMVV